MLLVNTSAMLMRLSWHLLDDLVCFTIPRACSIPAGLSSCEPIKCPSFDGPAVRTTCHLTSKPLCCLLLEGKLVALCQAINNSNWYISACTVWPTMASGSGAQMKQHLHDQVLETCAPVFAHGCMLRTGLAKPQIH